MQLGALIVAVLTRQLVDAMAALYNIELNSILDRLVPFGQILRHSRPSDPWFDHDCRSVKRLTRRP